MDKIPNSIIQSIKELVSKLKSNNIDLSNVVLFGSYAKVLIMSIAILM